MTEHKWEIELIECQIDNGEFWICRECGASGGPVGDGSEKPYPGAWPPSRLTPFLAGAGAKLSLDCDEAKQQVIVARAAAEARAAAAAARPVSLPLNKLIDDGLLFEINRAILHPLGLSLALVWESDDGSGEVTGVDLIKDRDPEGTVFAPENFTEGEKKLKAFMEREGTERLVTREAALGFRQQTAPEQGA